jgi:hypothetical protein
MEIPSTSKALERVSAATSSAVSRASKLPPLSIVSWILPLARSRKISVTLSLCPYMVLGQGVRIHEVLFLGDLLT